MLHRTAQVCRHMNEQQKNTGAGPVLAYEVAYQGTENVALRCLNRASSSCSQASAVR